MKLYRLILHDGRAFIVKEKPVKEYYGWMHFKTEDNRDLGFRAREVYILEELEDESSKGNKKGKEKK